MERNVFDQALRELAIRYAPEQIAKVGDVVTAQCGWKRPHKVQITSVAIEICGVDMTIARRKELGFTGWLTVQHHYIGRRLKADGVMTGTLYNSFLISEFTTSDGVKYERIPSGFNHVGLVFDLGECAV